MKTNFVTLFAALTLALAGCSSTPTRVDTGPIQARTFAFVSTDAKAPPAYADNRAAVHTMIQDAITRHLGAKNISKVSSGGDITVAYLVIVGDNATTAAISDYFGYGRDTAALHDKAHKAYAIDNQNPNSFQAGTLLIDIIDSKTYKLLKRNYASRPILRDVPLDARAARIQEAVDEVLKGLRVSG